MTLPKRLPKKPKRDNRLRSPGHLAWVRSHACCACGATSYIEAAHVRNGGDGGTSLKPGDDRTISLCVPCHRLQHQVGERAFEKASRINMAKLAAEFAAASPALRRLRAKMERG